MVHGVLAEASFMFRKRGGSVTRWLGLMTSAGEDLSLLARIHYETPRAPDESDEALRLRCLEGWSPDGEAGEDAARG